MVIKLINSTFLEKQQTKLNIYQSVSIKIRSARVKARKSFGTIGFRDLK